MLYNKNALKRLEELYPVGTTLRLIHMEDVRPVPPGTLGVVEYIDDAGQIHVRWENGSGLALVPGEDVFEVYNDKAINTIDAIYKTNKRVYDDLYSMYRAYVGEWLESHQGSEFSGMNPSSFDEWLTNDLSFVDPTKPFEFIGYPALTLTFENLGDTFDTEEDTTIAYNFSYISQQESLVVLDGYLRLDMELFDHLSHDELFDHVSTLFVDLAMKPDVASLSLLAKKAVIEVATNDSSMYFYEIDDFKDDIHSGNVKANDFIDLWDDIKKYNLASSLEVMIDCSLPVDELICLIHHYANLESPFFGEPVMTGYGDLAVLFDFSTLNFSREMYNNHEVER